MDKFNLSISVFSFAVIALEVALLMVVFKKQ